MSIFEPNFIIDVVEITDNVDDIVAVDSPLIGGGEFLSGKSASPSHLEVSLPCSYKSRRIPMWRQPYHCPAWIGVAEIGI
jgi:hypothetical protein